MRSGWSGNSALCEETRPSPGSTRLLSEVPSERSEQDEVTPEESKGSSCRCRRNSFDILGNIIAEKCNASNMKPKQAGS